MRRGSYNPTDYWLSRGKVYKEKFKYDAEKQLQEEVTLDYLKTVSPFPSVLEIGCGFGRFSNLVISSFPEIEEYVAIDLSPDQLANAKSYVKSDKVRFVESDIQSLHLDKKYDLVFGVSVLLHILPDDIKQVVRKLVSLSKKHVINVDYYEQGGNAALAPHNFMHDYESLYKSLPSVASVKRIPVIKKENGSLVLDTKQSLFHALMETNR